MRRLGWLVWIALLASPAAAFEGRYHVRGTGPDGAYDGDACVEPAGSAWRVVVQTFDGDGGERRAECEAPRSRDGLHFTYRAYRGLVPEAPLAATLHAIGGDPDSLVVTYRDVRGRVVRREAWVKSERIRIPLLVVSLAGDERFPGVTSAQATEAQAWIAGQLDGVFAPIDVSFRPLAPRPVEVAGAPFDLDGDGRLAAGEVAALRDALEARGLKRPGRAVVVITRADLVHEGCRGWTLGDAEPTPDTLEDLNDDFSILGLEFIDPSRFHTVAHEVCHQFGLDDLRDANRWRLAAPESHEQLMDSGGTGLELDPRLAVLLRRACERFPDHGLEGRRAPGVRSLTEAQLQAVPDLGNPRPLPPAGLPPPNRSVVLRAPLGAER